MLAKLQEPHGLNMAIDDKTAPGVMRALKRTVLCGAASVTMTAIAAGQQTVGSFRCDSHTVAIDRLPGAKSIPAKEPDKQDSHKILQADFSGFDPQYSLESVGFVVLFAPNPPTPYGRPDGKLRVLALLRSHGSDQWRELAGDDTEASPAVWYDNRLISDLLRVNSEPAEAGLEPDPSDDPTVEKSGRPQIRIHQAQKGTPVFFLKFIGLTPAGGHGDVDAERAMALDLRRGTLAAPAAVGCVKNDFAGEGHEDEWIDCQWRPTLQDYVCKNNAHYSYDWEFLLIKGEKLPAKAKPRR
jgi:hypothetical protein